MKTWITTSVAVAAWLASGCGEEPSAPGTGTGPSPIPAAERPAGPGATPEETFATARAALARNDHVAFLACLTRDCQEAICVFMLMGVSFSMRDHPEHRQEYEALLTRHGVAPASAADPFAATKDLPSFLHDLVAFAVDRLGRNPMDDSSRQEIGALRDVKVEGDSATGTVVTRREDGTSREEPVEFRRVGGAWAIRFEMK